MSTPARSEPPWSVWSRFALDPRSSGDLRAGDADREVAREVIAEAYAQGQLTHEEYSQRLGDVLQTSHLGQLVPLLSDIQIRPSDGAVAPRRTATPPAPRPAATIGGLALPPSGVTRTALFVIAVTNLVWVWTSISSGSLIYYWPMWPALGMAIMVLSTIVFADPNKPRHERRERKRRELE